MDYVNNLRLLKMAKQTQSKPTCGEQSRTILLRATSDERLSTDHPLVLRAWRRFQFTIYYL
jgi:hypothetical protein